MEKARRSTLIWHPTICIGSTETFRNRIFILRTLLMSSDKLRRYKMCLSKYWIPVMSLMWQSSKGSYWVEKLLLPFKSLYTEGRQWTIGLQWFQAAHRVLKYTHPLHRRQGKALPLRWCLMRRLSRCIKIVTILQSWQNMLITWRSI